MTHKRIDSSAGIAIGPILFVVALLAILATAIAAGSSTFSASSTQESARTLATALIDQCSAYKAAMDRLLMGHNCDPTRLDITPPTFPTGTTWTNGDFTSSNGTNRAGNGNCALYDPRGGTMTFTQVPSATLATPSTGLWGGGYGDPQMDYWAGYPMLSGTHCITGVGTCNAGSSRRANMTLHIFPIRQDVCDEVNSILKNNTSSASVINTNDSAGYNMYAGAGLRTGVSVGTSGGISGSTVREMCGKQVSSATGYVAPYQANVYYCTVLVQ